MREFKAMLIIFGTVIYTLVLIAVFRDLSTDSSFIFLGISVAVYLALLIYNFILGKIIKNKYHKSKFKKIIENLTEQFDSGKITYQKSLKKLNRVYFLASFYLFLVVIANLTLIAALLIISIKEGRPIFMAMVIPIFVLVGIAKNFFGGKMVNFGYFLTPKDYPVFYSILDEVKKELNVKKDIYLYAVNGENASIIYHKDKYHVSFGIYLLMALNVAEIKSILYHEFGHLIYKDSLRLSKRQSLLKNLENSEKKSSGLTVGRYFTLATYNYVAIEFSIHEIVISKNNELKADQIVKDKGLNKEYVSALIKAEYLKYSLNSTTFRTFGLVSEELSATLYNDCFDEFVKDLPSNEEKYQYYINHEIETKRSSHPVLRTRMEIFGISDFNYSEIASYDEEEVNKILLEFNRIDENASKNYSEQRKQYYLKQLKVIELYEDNPSEEEIKILDYAFALSATCQESRAYHVFERILKIYPNCAQALYGIGCLKLNVYDDASGIDDLYQAARLNRNYIDSLMLIGDFAIKMGLKDEHERFKKEVLAMHQEAIDIDYENISSITKKSRLSKVKLPDDIENEIKKIADFHRFNQLYVVRKMIKDDFFVDIVCVRLDAKGVDVSDGLNSIFKILDTNEGQYGLHVLTDLSLGFVTKVTTPFFQRKLLK